MFVIEYQVSYFCPCMIYGKIIDMKKLLFILLLAVIGMKVYSGSELERQVMDMAIPETIVQDGEEHDRHLAYKALEKALDFSACCDEVSQSASHQFHVSQRLLLRSLQISAQQINRMQAKDLIRYIQHQTTLGESSHEMSYCIGRAGEQSLYVYAIRHLLI